MGWVQEYSQRRQNVSQISGVPIVVNHGTKQSGPDVVDLIKGSGIVPEIHARYGMGEK